MSLRTSAGILLYRQTDSGLEVLLGHPGGPFFARRDEGVWSIPKGEVDDGDGDLLEVACREFAEETGLPVPDGPRLGLGSVVQRSGKVVHAWAVEGDLDPAVARSNTFDLEWPPGSGRVVSFPEIDRVDWLSLAEARRRISPAQSAFLDRLVAVLRYGP
jgi:predicted NUDIX family NTP pyrophosphohydrolase